MSKSVMFLILNICNTMCCMSLSVISPFFPQFAFQNGIGSTLVGFIFSGQPLGAILGSLKIGQVLTKDNKNYMMQIAMIMQGANLMCFVLAYIIKGYYFIIILTYLARVSNGIAYAIFVTTFYSSIPALYPDEVEQKMGVAELSSSLGFVLGPSIGTLLFSIGGFCMPFIIFSLASVFIGLYLQNVNNQDKKTLQSDIELLQLNHETQDSQPILQLQTPIEYTVILQKYIILTNAMIPFLVSMMLTYQYPVVANFLKVQYQKDEDSVGYYMSINPLAYAICSTIITQTKARCQKQMIFIGMMIVGLGQIYYGPDVNLTGLDYTINSFIIAQIITGFMIAYPFIYSLPQLNDSLIEEYPNQIDQCHNIGSALFSAAISLGEFIGPLGSGYLHNTLGYERICSIFGIGTALITLLYIKQLIK